MNILICCSTGFSASILVKSMRDSAQRRGLEDYKIISVGVEQIHMYIAKTDIILIAPQNRYSYKMIYELARPYHIPILLINRDAYGDMDGNRVLLQAETELELRLEEKNMKGFTSIIETKLTPIAIKVGNNNVLTVIRNAMCATMSMLIIGSVCVLLTNLPIKSLSSFIAPIAPFLNTVYNCTSGMLGIFTVAGMGYYGAVQYKTDIFSSVLSSVAAFLITQISLEGELNLGGLGSSGLITALIVGFVTVKVIDLFKRKHWVISMPEGVPEAVSESFTSLIPAIIVIIFFGLITHVFGLDINVIMSNLLSPIAAIINNPFGYAFYHMLCGLVFFCGINSAVVVGVVLPFILQNGAANEAGILAGNSAQFIATKSTDILIWSGGTGATIGLVVMMAFMAKSKAFKTLGRMSVAPGLFNINEPVIFGTPICFNPIFFIPFVFVPGILAFLTYIVMDFGMVDLPTVSAIPWTIPPVIQGMLMSAGSMSTIIWSIIVVIISFLGYYPFFKIADRAEYKKELEAEKLLKEQSYEK